MAKKGGVIEIDSDEVDEEVYAEDEIELESEPETKKPLAKKQSLIDIRTEAEAEKLLFADSLDLDLNLF